MHISMVSLILRFKIIRLQIINKKAGMEGVSSDQL